MDDDAKGECKSSDSDSSTWDFGGEETQIVDTQCFDSATSSPGNKINIDDTDQMHILQSTNPFDDTAIFEDDIATQLIDHDGETQLVNLYEDTQVVNFDTEIEEMDMRDSLERNATQLFNDSDTEELVVTDNEETQKIEIVDDSDEDSSKREREYAQHNSGVGFKNFTSIRAASMRASGLAAKNKASQKKNLINQELDQSTGIRSGFGRSTARKLFAEETFLEAKDGNDETALCETANSPMETDFAGLPYLDSQEPGDASQQNALDFVDNFLKVNIESSDKCEINKSSERKSKPVLSAKGIQTLAKSCNLFNAVGEREIYEWDDDHEDEGGGEFLKRKKELLLPIGGQKLKSSTSSRRGKNFEKSKSKKHDLVCSDSKLGLTNGKGKSKLGFEDGTKDVQETTDVRFDTQMAAEAMEDLCFELHKTAYDSTKEGQDCNNMQNRSQVKKKAPNNGVRTRQSKSKRTDESETDDTVPLKELKRSKSTAKKNVASDVGKKGRLPLTRREVDTTETPVASVDQKSTKKRCVQTVVPVTRRTRQSMRDNESAKVNNDLTEEMNIITGFHPKGKRSCQKLSSGRLTRSKAATLSEHVNENENVQTCNLPCTEGSPREKIELINSACTTPVNRATPLKESSPIIMGDEYLKQSWKKSRLRSVIKEVDTSTPIASPSKDTRKRRDMSMICVLFSRHLDGDIVKQQKKILSRLRASETTWMSDATHFIADEFVRTKNMLEAIALGKPVVTHLWLESCRQAHCHIDEKNFILRDAKKETEFGFSLPASLSSARKDPLLKGHRVLITPNTKPGKEILATLVKAVGGVVVERLGRTAVKDDKVPEGLILSCEEDYALCLPFLEKGATVYSSELLLNGIVTQRLEYERHRLFLDRVKRKRSKR